VHLATGPAAGARRDYFLPAHGDQRPNQTFPQGEERIADGDFTLVDFGALKGFWVNLTIKYGALETYAIGKAKSVFLEGLVKSRVFYFGS